MKFMFLAAGLNWWAGKWTRIMLRKYAESKAYPYIIDSLIFIVLVAFAFAIYFPSIKGPFIFDDKPNILYSPAVQMTEFSFSTIKKAAFEGTTSSRPVVNISFALNYFAGRDDVSGYHVVNIFIHALTGFFLYLFFRVTIQIIKRSRDESFPSYLPFVAALLWFVHPVQSQSVAYIVQRMNSMSAMFYLLSMLLYVHGRLTTRQRKRAMLFAGSTVSALLAFASKENAATLPLFVFLYEWYFFQNLKVGWLKSRWLYISGAVGSFLALAIVFLGSNPIGRIMSSYQGRDFTLGQRLLTELRVVFIYLGKLLFPHPDRLGLEHDIPLSYFLLLPLTTFISAVFLAALVGLAIWLAKRHRLLSFAILWYLGNLIIESSFIGLEIIFEHRNYLPSMFLALSLVVFGEKLIKSARVKLVLAVIILIFCSLWSNERSRVWADEEILLRDCIKKAPNKHRMYTNLGNALSRKGKYGEGENAFYQALRIEPFDSKAYIGLGNNSFNQQNYNEAVSHYRRGLLYAKSPGDIFQLRYGLGIINQEIGRFQEAMRHYTVALRIRPDYQPVRYSINELRNKAEKQKK